MHNYTQGLLHGILRVFFVANTHLPDSAAES